MITSSLCSSGWENPQSHEKSPFFARTTYCRLDYFRVACDPGLTVRFDTQTKSTVCRLHVKARSRIVAELPAIPELLLALVDPTSLQRVYSAGDRL